MFCTNCFQRAGGRCEPVSGDRAAGAGAGSPNEAVFLVGDHGGPLFGRFKGKGILGGRGKSKSPFPRAPLCLLSGRAERRRGSGPRRPGKGPVPGVSKFFHHNSQKINLQFVKCVLYCICKIEEKGSECVYGIYFPRHRLRRSDLRRLRDYRQRAVRHDPLKYGKDPPRDARGFFFF